MYQMPVKDMFERVLTFTPQYRQLMHQRVDQGIKVLVKHFGPDWYKKINTKNLVLRDTCKCVLGQCFAKEARRTDGEGFFIGLRELDLSQSDAVKYGFNLPTGETILSSWDPNVPKEVRGEDGATPNHLKAWTLLGDIWIARINQAKREKQLANLKNQRKPIK